MTSEEEDVIIISSDSEDESLRKQVKDGIDEPVGIGGNAWVTDLDSEKGVSNEGMIQLQGSINEDTAFVRKEEEARLFDDIPMTVAASVGICSFDNEYRPTISTSNLIECIEIDDDNARPLAIPSTSTSTLTQNEEVTTVKEEIRTVLETFVKSLKKCMTKKDYRQVKGQVWNTFDKVGVRNAEAATKMKAFVLEIVKESEGKPKSIWRPVKKLLDFLNSRQTKSRKFKHENETPKERLQRERKKDKLIVRLEKRLAKMEKAIEHYGNLEVDFSNETNSSFLIRSRMINKYMKCFKLICKLKGCSYYTGRPIEKRIALQEGITKFTELNKAVEKFVNSKRILFVPDFCDIKKVVLDFNAEARPPPLCDSEIHCTAKELFNEVLRIIRNRRLQDMETILPVETVTNDPAENDEDLRKKLDENDKLRKSEEEVIARFVKEQEARNEVAMEVEEDPESSAAESDDEVEEED